MSNATKVLKNNLGKLLAATQSLTGNAAYVGIPQDHDHRDDSGPMNNATIGYLMDHGMPEQNVPAREWLRPGIASVQGKIVKALEQGAAKALKGEYQAPEQALDRAGIIGMNGAKAFINAGIPPALAESTLKARARRGRKGAMWELAWRAAGAPAGTDLAKPLVDTGQFRNSITYVIRKKK